MEKINVAMIGQGFMGRSHSNAWGQVAKFFAPPLKPVMHTVFGQEAENPQAFADNWGWQNASSDWEAVVNNPEIGIVDIVTPNFMHAPPAKAAIAAGKHVACEKPIAGTLDEAREMAQAANKAGIKTAVWFCYRRCPAVAGRNQRQARSPDRLFGQLAKGDHQGSLRAAAHLYRLGCGAARPHPWHCRRTC